MIRKGYYGKPAGYVDHELLAMQQLADEENAKLEARRKLDQLRAEKERLDRLEELNDILRALAAEQEAHPLWEQVVAAWSSSIRAEVRKNPQAITNSPGVAATTRIALRAIFGYPE
jgi:pyruvate/oxaloacetate carboxyltransferase